MKDNEDDEDFEVSNLRYAMEECGPAFIKLGQLLATRPDLVGNEIADDLKLLRDSTPVTSFDEMKAIFEEEIGQTLEEAYSEFDEEPLGSASIGQVYKARLKETAQEVAVKVQKLGIIDVIEPDVKILNKITGTLDKHVLGTRTYNLPAMAQEFERSIFKELDGFFYTSPHPGNLFVTKDNKLCYIDMGMIGVVNDTFRSNFAQLVLLLLDGNSDD